MSNPWKRREVIGDCVLYLGDCLSIMPALGKVDAVDCNGAVECDENYEKSASRQREASDKGGEKLGGAPGADNSPLCQWRSIANGDGADVWSIAGWLSESDCAHGHSVEGKREGGAFERSIYRREPIDGISADGDEGKMQPLRGDGSASDSSHGSRPYEQRLGESGSSLQSVPFESPQIGVVAFPKGWAILTDPPYGIGADRNLRANKKHGKAAAPSRDYGSKNWDASAPDMSWAASAGVPAIVWGGNYFSLPASSGWLVWDKENGSNGYADCELAWSNIPMALRRFKWRWAGMLQQNMADKEERVHPTQKPVEVMKWCLGFLPDAETILDPFMGSGTTLVACAKLGRKGVGIELDPDYFEIACRRVREAYAQPDMFVEQAKPSAPVQEGFDL